MCLLGLTLEANLAVDARPVQTRNPIGSERVLLPRRFSVPRRWILIEDPGWYARFGDAEVTGIGQVEEIHAELKLWRSARQTA